MGIILEIGLSHEIAVRELGSAFLDAKQIRCCRSTKRSSETRSASAIDFDVVISDETRADFSDFFRIARIRI
jgi:hypothetical protein